MHQVKISKRLRFSHDGKASRWYEPGEEYEVDAEFVRVAKQIGILESLDGEALGEPKKKKSRGGAPENKADS